jgi:hypothetical protein
MKKIPYGIASYELIREKDYYYVDKTPYLNALEQTGRYLFFIRPRRFGKSLFISMMETYYDVYYKDKFEEFFKGTWIHENATDEQGKYLVLTFNFSLVEPDPARLESSFLHHVRERALSFIKKYSPLLSTNHDTDHEYVVKTINESQSCSGILSSIITYCKDAKRQLYVFIDEYDNFANTILSSRGNEAYRDLTHGPGFYRSFFNVLKGGTTGSGAPVTRSFITGVSPVTMDDVTSGYNIGESVSLDGAFNSMLGFTRREVGAMLDYYKTGGLIEDETGGLLEIMSQWYGNYLFSKHAEENQRLFNSDMILYFLKQYFKTGSIPDDLVDRNVRIDYGKLRHLIIVDRDKAAPPTANGNFSKLRRIIEEGGTSAEIAGGFPLEKLTDARNFKSLLFYLGLLTIKGTDRDRLWLEIPNETVKRLYYDYIDEAYRETHVFDLDISTYSDLMTGMAYDGEWKPLMDFLTLRMKESMSLRDLVTGERSIQAFLNVYLGLSNLFIIHPEREMNKGYADIVMEPFLARYQGIKYSFILELKYVNAGVKPADPVVLKLKEEAENQLKRYSLDKRFKKITGKTELIKLVLVFSGHECVYSGPVE